MIAAPVAQGALTASRRLPAQAFQLQLLISAPPKNCNLLFSPRNAFVLSCPFMAHKSVWCSALLQCYTCSEQCTVHQSPHALVLALLQLFYLDQGVRPSVRPSRVKCLKCWSVHHLHLSGVASAFT